MPSTHLCSDGEATFSRKVRDGVGIASLVIAIQPGLAAILLLLLLALALICDLALDPPRSKQRREEGRRHCGSRSGVLRTEVEVGRATEYGQSKMMGAIAGWRSSGPEWLPSQR